jgi:hypothetical protein
MLQRLFGGPKRMKPQPSIADVNFGGRINPHFPMTGDRRHLSEFVFLKGPL